MPHYYFDIETAGLDPNKDQILTIQYQKIAIDNGKPEEPLTILSSWKSSERKIVEQIIPKLITSNPFSFVPVGNNLNFEFKFLAAKLTKYCNMDIDSSFFHSRPYIDLKHVMILLNGGRFKGYHLILNKAGNGSDVPKWYQSQEYDKILNYIKHEAKSFTKFYADIHSIIFNKELHHRTFHKLDREIDEFV